MFHILFQNYPTTQFILSFTGIQGHTLPKSFNFQVKLYKSCGLCNDSSKKKTVNFNRDSLEERKRYSTSPVDFLKIIHTFVKLLGWLILSATEFHYLELVISLCFRISIIPESLQTNKHNKTRGAL
jgi:hypothetical protein